MSATQCSDTSHEGRLAGLQSAIVNLERENARLRGVLAAAERERDASDAVAAQERRVSDMREAERDEARHQLESWKILANRANERADAAERALALKDLPDMTMREAIRTQVIIDQEARVRELEAQVEELQGEWDSAERRCAQLEGERDELLVVRKQRDLAVEASDALAQQLQRVQKALDRPDIYSAVYRAREALAALPSTASARRPE